MNFSKFLASSAAIFSFGLVSCGVQTQTSTDSSTQTVSASRKDIALGVCGNTIAATVVSSASGARIVDLKSVQKSPNGVSYPWSSAKSKVNFKTIANSALITITDASGTPTYDMVDTALFEFEKPFELPSGEALSAIEVERFPLSGEQYGKYSLTLSLQWSGDSEPQVCEPNAENIDFLLKSLL